MKENLNKSLITAMLMALFSCAAMSQSADTLKVKAEIIDGDTIAAVDLQEAMVIAPQLAANPDEVKKFAKLVRMVKKVYPYAKLAGIRFNEMNAQIRNAPSKKEERRIINAVEEEIQNKYGPELKKLTFSQGKILIKLLDRETGNTSYALVKEFKGMFMAFFYQNFAKLWGYNLKTKYDPQGEDRDIEMIVQLIEKGQI